VLSLCRCSSLGYSYHYRNTVQYVIQIQIKILHKWFKIAVHECLQRFGWSSLEAKVIGVLDAEGGAANFEGVGLGTDLIQELVFICASFILYRRIISRKTLSSSLLTHGSIHWVLGVVGFTALIVFFFLSAVVFVSFALCLDVIIF